MVVTLNEDKTVFTVTSDNFNSDNQEVTLTFNSCGGTAEEFSISVDDTSYDVSSDTAYTDSVYSFKLSITTIDGDILEENSCYFIGEDMKCDAIEWYKSQDIEKSLYYAALVASNNCISCSCTDLCTLYTALTTTQCNDFKCTSCSTCN